jgi:hypothetical protein
MTKDFGFTASQMYIGTVDDWVDRYTGWYKTPTKTRTCGHMHASSNRALRCAKTLFTQTRKQSQ